MIATAIKRFVQMEAASGILLLTTAMAAIVWANLPAGLDSLYHELFAIPIAFQVGDFALEKPFLLWVNDGLMAIFFFLVGLEIKREVIEGELSSIRKATLPTIAAIGGMVCPAIVYAIFNHGDSVALQGWAIPTATDIAFALGVLALLGPRVPVSLKIFLLALAIIDDLGAIVIIAIWYSSNLSAVSLLFAGLILIALATLNVRGVTRLSLYIVLGVLLWVTVLKSGVHATLAGVALALMIPLRAETKAGESPLRRLEHVLHPWVAFLIMPLFAFANSGVSLRGLSLDHLMSPIPIGIAAGLFLGKQIGVFSFSWIACRVGIAEMPSGVSLRQFYGVALLTGVGFTMSLFIGTLAFDSSELTNFVRLGVLTGSIASAVAGYLVLQGSAADRRAAQPVYERQGEVHIS